MADSAAIASMLLWTPTTGYPTSTPTTFHSVATTKAPELVSLLLEVMHSLATETKSRNLLSLSQVYRGLQASLTIVSAEQALETATDKLAQAQATKALFEASVNLHALADEENLYGEHLNRGGNIFYFVVFTLLAFFFLGAVSRSRYHWFNITFSCGFILEMLGFLGRVLAFTDNTNINFYLMQYVSLTIAAAFLMAGVYFLFAQNVVIHGRQYLVLKPMWYSYFFIFADVFSLLVQAIGGGMALAASSSNQDPKPGTWVMFAGMIIQVFSMTIFIVFWCEFLTRIYFRNSDKVSGDSLLKKKGPVAWLKLLFNSGSARQYKMEHLDQFYNAKYTDIRNRKLVSYYPLVISLSVIFIYIRCIYRVVELKQGFDGYLATHEIFLMFLDALMIAFVGFLFVAFHPMFVFGQTNVLKVSAIKKNEDESTHGAERENKDEKREVDNNTGEQNSLESQLQSWA